MMLPVIRGMRPTKIIGKTNKNMTTYRLKRSDLVKVERDGKEVFIVSNDFVAGFSEALLGLGDISKDSTATDTIAAVFDLEGFTNFCKQIEPHLAVPLFLSEFLTWLMSEIRDQMIDKKSVEGTELWAPFPFYSKFMGDGILFLWDCSHMSHTAIRNVIVSCHDIQQTYAEKFLPSISKKVAEAPHKLRCGLARGTVYSVGEGNDYVGSCINMAARLQKMPGLSFAFNRRGIDVEFKSAAKFYKEMIVVKKVSIRGIGDSELICVVEKEFAQLKRSDRKFYGDP